MNKQTIPVSDAVFKAVYDSPASLPGKYKWLTSSEDVREMEKLLGMPQNTIGAPLWVSGDSKQCPKCHREINWLDIVSSAVGHVHSREMIAQVMLGSQKYVNVEAPNAIAGVHCFKCKTVIPDLRSFKCHNWEYAKQDLLAVVEKMQRNAAN